VCRPIRSLTVDANPKRADAPLITPRSFDRLSDKGMITGSAIGLDFDLDDYFMGTDLEPTSLELVGMPVGGGSLRGSV